MDNATRRQLLEQTKQAQQEGFKGSIMDVYSNPQILQQQSPVAVANTPQQQSQGLRGVERQNAPQAMVFPNLAPNTPMNTKGMKFNVDMDMYDPKGHLMQSYKNVPPGVESLPTGPRGATVVERPTKQTGGRNVTTADSLFLYNKVQDLYKKLNNMGAKEAPGDNWKGAPRVSSQDQWEKSFGSNIAELKDNISTESKLGNDGTVESSDYYDNINDKFYGTTDFLQGGGDDIDFPISYINQYIKPQSFQDNEIYDPRGRSRQVASYMYDPLVIKPDYLLTDEERAIRNHPDFKPNTNIKRPSLSSRKADLTLPTPSPAKKPSYPTAYKGVDKKKYPTLESFIEAAENYKKYGSNTKPVEEEIKYKKYLEDKKKYDTYLKESAAEDADNTARLLRNVATDPDNPNWTPLDQYLVMNRLVKPVSEPEYVKPPSKVKSKETTEEKTDSSKPIRSSKFSEEMVRNQPVSIPEVLTVPIPNNPIFRMDQNSKTGQKIVGERTTENGKQKEIYFSKDKIKEVNKSNLIKRQTGGKNKTYPIKDTSDSGQVKAYNDSLRMFNVADASEKARAARYALSSSCANPPCNTSFAVNTTRFPRPVQPYNLITQTPPPEKEEKPVKNPSYEKAYEKVKDKYDTLEDFKFASKYYNENGENPPDDLLPSNKVINNVPIRSSKFSEDMVRNQNVPTSKSSTISTSKGSTISIPKVPIYKMEQGKYKTGQKIIGETIIVDGKPKNIYFPKDRIEELNKPNLIKKETGGYKRLPKY